MRDLWEIKKWMSRAFYMNIFLKSYQRELNQLREIYPFLGKANIKVIGGKIEPAYVRGVEKITEIEDKIKIQIEKLIRVRNEIEEAIERLVDDRQKIVMRQRYLEFLKWEEIAEENKLCVRQIYRIHKESLKKLKEVSQCH